jgi:hypothetical protein
MPIKRLHYFDHQFLVQADFADEQQYHLDMRRRLNRLLHTVGIAEGLEVVKSGNKTVTVRSGMAIDRLGREMIVEANQEVDLSQFLAGATIFITIAYHEQESDPTTATSVSGNTRITEQPLVQAVTTTPPNDSTVIPLARFTLDSSANVPGNSNDLLDGGVRQIIGPRGERLASLNGVSNPGGNVDLVPGTGIAITPDQTNRRITIANQGLVSVSGVSNPGSNINLSAPLGQAITIVPNDATNQIVISEDHSTKTGNVHSLTAADLQQIGALLASDYDLGKRALRNVTFNDANKTGAQQTVSVPFQPRLVWVVGMCTSRLGSIEYGGGVSAFADLEPNPIIQQCFGLEVTKVSTTDWFGRGFSTSGICTGLFLNLESPPIRGERLSVAITNVSTTGLIATLTRTVTGGASTPSQWI